MLFHLCGNMYCLITRFDFARKSFLAPAILFSVVLPISLLQTFEERGYVLTLGSTEGSAGNKN